MKFRVLQMNVCLFSLDTSPITVLIIFYNLRIAHGRFAKVSFADSSGICREEKLPEHNTGSLRRTRLCETWKKVTPGWQVALTAGVEVGR